MSEAVALVDYASQLELSFDSGADAEETTASRVSSWEEFDLLSGATQLNIDFSNDSDPGYLGWKQERQDRLMKLRSFFGLPILKRVRVRLRGLDEELEGLLRLAAEPEALVDKRQALMLRIGDQTFSSHEIASVIISD